MHMPPPLLDWMNLPAGFAPPRPAYPAARLKQWVGYKRWIFLLLNTDAHQIGLAWVDLGYISKIFGHFSPLIPGAEPFSVETLCPGQLRPWRRVGAGWSLNAGTRALRLSLRQEAGGTGLLNLSGSRLALSARWETGPQPLLWADAPLPHHTHKSFAQPARWRIEVPGYAARSEGLLGADVSYGWPPRHTRWFWAFAQSPELGFNLVEGFVGAAECGLWHAGQISPLSEGRFEMPADDTRPWRITTAADELELNFAPRSILRDKTELGLIRSDFTQAYGRFRGQIRLADGRSAEVDLAGVAEFQDTLW